MSYNLLLLIFCISVILSLVVNNHSYKIEQILLLIILVVIITFRSEIMPDYLEYVKYYQYGTDRIEPFFQFIIGFLNSLNFGYITFFLLVAGLTVCLKWSLIRKMCPLWRLSLLVWLSNSFILNEMITIRAGLASAFLLCLIYYKCKGENIKALLMVICAICCHYSAIVLFPLLMLSTTKLKKNIYIGALLISFILAKGGFSFTDYLGFVGIQFFDRALKVYLDSEEANPFNLIQLMRVGLCLMLWLRVKTISQLNKYFLYSLKIFTIGCIFFFANYKIMAIAWRVGDLLWITDIIIFPYLIYIFSNKYQPIYKVIPLTLCIGMFYFGITSPYWG